MSLKEWLYDKRVYFLIHTFISITILVFLRVFGMNSESLIFVGGLLFVSHTSFLVYEYMRRYKYYKNINELLSELDKKYLVHELIEEAHFYEGNFLYDFIHDVNKSMNDEIQKYRLEQKEYADYIETWVHEIKTPLSASSLILENNSSAINGSIVEELDKVESYVEQALYYAKSNHLERDYIIKDTLLKDVVQASIRKHSKMLIAKKCQIELDELDAKVKSDEKWLTFIINQIIVNAIQYSKEKMLLKIYQSVNEQNTLLTIEDRGIGIRKEDKDHVFQKGFTGVSGRTDKKSTGIGLYLCKKLATKMGHDIRIESEYDQYTRVIITFSHSSMY